MKIKTRSSDSAEDPSPAPGKHLESVLLPPVPREEVSAGRKGQQKGILARSGI